MLALYKRISSRYSIDKCSSTKLVRHVEDRRILDTYDSLQINLDYNLMNIHRSAISFSCLLKELIKLIYERGHQEVYEFI